MKLLSRNLKYQWRGITTSKTLYWDEVKTKHHPVDNQNPFLQHPKTVSVIGCPMTYGQPLLGTDHGPQMLREHGLHDTITELNWSVEENGDLELQAPRVTDPVILPQHGKAKQSFAVGNGLHLLHEKVYEKAQEGKFCLVLGGDHTIGGGTLAGLLRARPNTGCIWVDAHADINTPTVSPSGNMHGMPLSFLIKGLTNNATVPGFEWFDGIPPLAPEQLVYVGLRDVDSGERQLIRQLGIKAFTMMEVDRYGIGKVMEMALDHLCSKIERPLHMSYDIDAVDPMIAPSTGTTVRGGLTWREANYVAESVAESNLLCSLDMVEVNPSLAPGKGSSITIDMALLLTSSALGNRIL